MGAGRAGLWSRGRAAAAQSPLVSRDPSEESPCGALCGLACRGHSAVLAEGARGWVSGDRERGRPPSLRPALRPCSVPFPGGLDGDQVLRQKVRALRRGRHRPDAASVLLQRRPLQRGRGARPGRPPQPGPRPPARIPPEPPMLEPPGAPPVHPAPRMPSKKLAHLHPASGLLSGLRPAPWAGRASTCVSAAVTLSWRPPRPLSQPLCAPARLSPAPRGSAALSPHRHPPI